MSLQVFLPCMSLVAELPDLVFEVTDFTGICPMIRTSTLMAYSLLVIVGWGISWVAFSASGVVRLSAATAVVFLSTTVGH